MNDIEKLFRKISRKDREALCLVIERILKQEKDLAIKKLKGGEFYRVRRGNFRIIFHHSSNGDVVIDSIRLRNESTYKDF